MSLPASEAVGARWRGRRRWLRLAFAAGLVPAAALQQGLAPSALHRAGTSRHADSLGVEEPEPYRQVLQNWDGHGLEYAATFEVGGQVVRGILDTGSFELLVFSSNCSSCGTPSQRKSFYDSSASGSYEGHSLRTLHSFGSGDTWSQLAFDSVVFDEKLKVDRQYFWEVVSAQLPVLEDDSFQAIIGVGPPSTPRRDTLRQSAEPREMMEEIEEHPEAAPSAAVVNATKDALQLVDEKTLLENLDVRTFSVCLKKYPESADGYFVWNDPSAARQPELFAKVPIASETSWGVQLTNAHLEGGEVSGEEKIGCGSGCMAIVDSGTSLLVVPTAVLERAIVHLNKLDDNCENMAAMPHLAFELGGRRFSLPPEAYIGKVVGQIPAKYAGYMRRHNTTTFTKCQVLLMTLDVNTPQGNMWILGMPFLREYYTTFDIGADMWDKRSRSLSMARPDADCNPTPFEPRAELLQRWPPRVVDLSRVRLPAWVEAAASRGWADV